MARCVVVDYGIGNVYSVVHAFQNCGADVELTSDQAKIMNADRLVLPGVGAFGRAAEAICETVAWMKPCCALPTAGVPCLGSVSECS